MRHLKGNSVLKIDETVYKQTESDPLTDKESWAVLFIYQKKCFDCKIL